MIIKKKIQLLLIIIVVFGLLFATCNNSGTDDNTNDNKTPVADDYTISNLSQIPGNVTAVIITVKNGKSPGAISNIQYNGSTTIPQTTGNYTVTFDVAEAKGWNAATGLSIGTLNVIDITPKGNTLAEKLAWLNTNAISGISYTLEVTNETLAPQNLSYTGKNNITITLKGNNSEQIISISDNGSLFTIENGVTLILDENITLQGHNNNNASLIKVNNGGKLVMETGSKITGNNAYSLSSYIGGGGVYVSNGTFTMNGGEISDNTTSSYNSNTYGGAVYVDWGTFIMMNGKISGNTAKTYGGGVYINGGTFTMTNGEISGNTPGGVYTMGTFTMNGGKITGNTTDSFGGGVNVRSGTFTMNSGEINSNTSGSGGGGVYLAGTSFNMNGGDIFDNSTSSSGGGVFASLDGILIKIGGTIYGSNGGLKANNAQDATSGNAVWVLGGSKRRENTAGLTDNLDVSKSGSEGGWEN